MVSHTGVARREMFAAATVRSACARCSRERPTSQTREVTKSATPISHSRGAGSATPSTETGAVVPLTPKAMPKTLIAVTTGTAIVARRPPSSTRRVAMNVPNSITTRNGISTA